MNKTPVDQTIQTIIEESDNDIDKYYIRIIGQNLYNERLFIYLCSMRVKDDEKIVRIYKAAIQIINQDGFQGSSMSKIAELANVSASTIYLYFENKDDMIKKLFIDIKNKIGASYFNHDMEFTPSKGTFRTIWLNHYQYIVENTDEYEFFKNFSNSPLITHIEKQHTADYCPTFESLFNQAKSKKLLLNLHNDIIYSMLFSPISHLIKKSKTSGITLNQNDLIQVFEASWRAIAY